jgi:nucleotide-binding universal stress UspA family protein
MSSRLELIVESLDEIAGIAKSARGSANGEIILVPVDFSEHSENALNFAATIAESTRAALIVLHVIHDPAEMPGYYSKFIEQKNLENVDDAAEQAFRDFMSRTLAANPDCSPLHKASFFMVVGLPVARILEVADELSPMMVVMGSHGRTGINNLIIGSKAAQVVQLCPFPVTIVKHIEKLVDE